MKPTYGKPVEIDGEWYVRVDIREYCNWCWCRKPKNENVFHDKCAEEISSLEADKRGGK